VVAPSPITIAAAAVSIASGLKNLVGGSKKTPSVHQGWRVQGTLTRDGLTGTTTAWDQKGNTWGGQVYPDEQIPALFRASLGESAVAIPVDVTIPAGVDFNATLRQKIAAGLASLSGAMPAPSAPASAASSSSWGAYVDPYTDFGTNPRANFWQGPAPRPDRNTNPPVNGMTPNLITPPEPVAPGRPLTTNATAQPGATPPPMQSGDFAGVAVLAAAGFAVLSMLG